MRHSLLVLSVISATIHGCGQPPPRSEGVAREVSIEEIEILGPGVRFSGLREIVLDGDVLWGLDAAPPYLTHITLRDGAFSQFGRDGEGPGEFKSPWSIQPTPHGAPAGVSVWDFGTRRVSVWSAEGERLLSEPLSNEMGIRFRARIREVSFVDPARIRRIGLETIYFSGRVDRTADVLSGSLTVAGNDLHPKDHFVRFSEYALKGRTNLREWTSVPLWDACQGIVVMWSPAESAVVWVNLNGERIDEVKVTLPIRQITHMDIERYLQRMARLELGPGWRAAEIDYKRLASRYEDRFAKSKPGATEIRCESRETAWLRLFDTESDPTGKGQMWIRVKRIGETTKFRFNHAFSPLVFSSRLVIGSVTMPDGSQALGQWRPANSLPASINLDPE